MGAHTNGNDCKHDDLEFSDYDLGWECQNPDCGQYLEYDEVVILTKAQHALEADVVEAVNERAKAKKILKDAMEEHSKAGRLRTYGDLPEWKPYENSREKLEKALTALEKGD